MMTEYMMIPYDEESLTEQETAEIEKFAAETYTRLLALTTRLGLTMTDFCITKFTQEELNAMPVVKKTTPIITPQTFKGKLKEDFNPFYDSEFLVSFEGSDERRMLVELYKDELLQLRAEIDAVLKHISAFEGTAEGA